MVYFVVCSRRDEIANALWGNDAGIVLNYYVQRYGQRRGSASY